jgi:hypothetical protein
MKTTSSTNGRYALKLSRADQARLRWGMLNAFARVGAVEAGITPADRVVWIDLFCEATPDIVQRSVNQIVGSTGLCERQVRYSLTRLQELTLLKELSKGRIGKGASKYKIRARMLPGRAGRKTDGRPEREK